MSSFCTAKATNIFSAKNFSIFAYHSIKILTNRYLTTSLALNNWALKIFIFIEQSREFQSESPNGLTVATFSGTVDGFVVNGFNCNF